MYKSYDLIKKLEPKIGEEEAKELIEFIESFKGDVATKTDLQLLKLDIEGKLDKLDAKIEGVKSDLEGKIDKLDAKIEGVKSELEAKIENLRLDLIGKIGTAKIDMLKWLFGFWITLLGTIIALWLSK